MAQQAGITSVYAQYGHKITGPEYDLLREVTHWTKEDVEREKIFKANFEGKVVIPEVVLEKSFSELSDSFEFFQFDRIDKKENIKNAIEVWKKIIDVQQHFNDIELRIRNYALTLITAVVGGIGFLEKEVVEIHLNKCVIPASALLGIFGLVILLAFFYMDKYWYHKLLIGAVNQGSFVENQNSGILPEMGLTRAIGEASPHVIGNKKIHSKHKFLIFYGLLFVPLLLITILLFLGGQAKKEVVPPIKANINQNGGVKSINYNNYTLN